MSYHGLSGLGAVAAITRVSPHTRSTAVTSLQQDLITLGFLPAGSADGLFGPNTKTALDIARRSLPATAAYAVVYGPPVSVPLTVLNAIHANAVAVGGSAAAIPATPTTMATPSTESGGDCPPEWITDIHTGNCVPNTVTASGGSLIPSMTDTTAAPAGGGSTMKWVLIGAGGLALVGAAVMFTRKKPAAVPAAVKANRRRMRRNYSFRETKAQALRHVLSGHANLRGAEKAERVRELVSQIGRSNLPSDLAREADEALMPNRRRRRAA